MMRKIDTLSNPEHKQQCAFVAIVSKSKIWKDYDGINEKSKAIEVPVTLMINRWDGKIGFPGGRMEEGETLKQTAIREAYEEIGVVLHEDELIPFVSYEIDIVGHLFLVKKDYEELCMIQRNTWSAEHAGSEICGTFLAQLYNYGRDRGIISLLRSNLAPTVRQELIEIMQYFKQLDSIMDVKMVQEYLKHIDL